MSIWTSSGLWGRWLMDGFNGVGDSAARSDHLDVLALATAHKRAAYGGLVGQFVGGGIGLDGADDGKNLGAARRLDLDGRAKLDGSPAVRLLGRLDDDSIVKDALKFLDLPLDHRLDVLGILVGATLADVTSILGLVDIVGDLLAALGDQEMEAGLLLLVTFACERDLLLLVVATSGVVSVDGIRRHSNPPH